MLEGVRAAKKVIVCAEEIVPREVIASVYVPLADITTINGKVSDGKTMDQAIKDWTDSYAGGLYGLAFLCVLSAVVCALFLDIPNPAGTGQRAQPDAAAAD